jgi:HD-GYP domain-containing protein (c-di-GMP phosphodiesterase class II)
VGSAYRIGGDEFCVIARGEGAEAVLELAQEALSEHNEGFTIRCGLGSVVIAADELSLEEALRTADQQLYINKAAARSDEDVEARDVLVRVIAEHSSTLAAHSSNVGRLAVAVAEKLGLSHDEVTLTRLTAELHDIGKTAIPDEILDKPGRLDDSEWAFVKQHTVIGERIVSAAPALARIASLVRATHERPDGTGYPDGLRRDEIPLSSRIVAVVDAYDAMTSMRSYSAVLTPEQAAAELSRCAGTQFDAAVVAAFVDVLGTLEGQAAETPARGLDARPRVAA